MMTNLKTFGNNIMNNNNHGGKRKNAGRKFKGKRVRFSTWVSPETHTALKKLASERGIPLSELLTQLVKREV